MRPLFSAISPINSVIAGQRQCLDGTWLPGLVCSLAIIEQRRGWVAFPHPVPKQKHARLVLAKR
jgi:hypothetical protein